LRLKQSADERNFAIIAATCRPLKNSAKNSCIAGPGAYDGTRPLKVFLVVHRDAWFLDIWKLWAGNGIRSQG
jgi:hypothetical protein